jgi:hypothetical protein
VKWPDLLTRAQALADSGGRRILGITGAPGAGKSTVARQLVDALGGAAVLVGMDGYHLAQPELQRLGRAERKGAPDTFDAAGYVALLRRLRAPDVQWDAGRVDGRGGTTVVRRSSAHIVGEEFGEVRAMLNRAFIAAAIESSPARFLSVAYSSL